MMLPSFEARKSAHLRMTSRVRQRLSVGPQRAPEQLSGRAKRRMNRSLRVSMKGVRSMENLEPAGWPRRLQAPADPVHPEQPNFEAKSRT